MRLSVLLICCVLISGCATMRYPGAYKVEGREFKEFKELNDDNALKVIALIYNMKHESREAGIARSIALEEYLGLLRKRNSIYIKRSGVFNIKYDKVKLSSWKSNGLLKLYDNLLPRIEKYRMDSAYDLTEVQNAERIVYLTAASSVLKELKKRDIAEKAMSVVSQVLMAALTVALSMI